MSDILDMTMREFFAMAERVGGAAKVIRDAQAMLGGHSMGLGFKAPAPEFPVNSGAIGYAAPAQVAGVLRSTPQPNPLASDVPEGLISRGKTGVEIIAERQREEIARRTGVILDPKGGLMDPEALAVKARLKDERDRANAEALAKMTPEQRAEFES